MAIPHEIPVGVLQEPKFSGAWEGGGPHPPSLLFFKWGVPSPHVPGQAIPIKTPEFTNHSLNTGDSTRTTGFGHAKKNPVAGKGGEGGDPHPPSLLFFKWGYPPPHVPGQQGVTPLPPQGPDRFGPL